MRLIKKEPIEPLYLAYLATQSSAQHNDNINWSIAVSFWVLISALLAFVSLNFFQNKIDILILLASLIGSVLCFVALKYSIKYNERINKKYELLKEIEGKIEEKTNCEFFKQHRIIQKRKRKITDYQIICCVGILYFALVFLMSIFYYF